MTLLSLDDRRRAAFGRIGRREDTLYEVTEHPDGSLLLTPVVVMSAAERDLLAGPAQLREAMADTLDGKKVSTRSVSARRPARS